MKNDGITRRQFLRRGLLGLTVMAGWRPSRVLGRTKAKVTVGSLDQENAVPVPDQRGMHSSYGSVSGPPISGAPMQLAALTLHEATTVAAIAAIIVPTDQYPGAAEANVVGYIDRKLSGRAAERQSYQDGVRWIDGASAKIFGRGRRFIDLSPEQRIEVLQVAEETLNMRLRIVASLWERVWRRVQRIYDDIFGLGEGTAFFRLVREDTLAGFYSNPVSWGMLGYVGPPQPRGYLHYEDCPPQARR